MDSNQKDQLLLISLARITFLSLSEKLNLLKKLDSFIDLALLSIEDIELICGRKIKSVWNGKENLRCARRELMILQAKKINFVIYTDSQYPALLRECSDAPFAIFYIGNISCLAGRTVSVVGTRRITPEAKKAAIEFAFDAANDGVTVVSGLANGVDGAAHLGAVNAVFDAMEKGIRLPGGRTCGVLPCGIDSITPCSNRRLAENILKTGGVIISEWVPGVPAESWRFVQRNRIIAALSPVTVVIQAPAGSGALITADFALEDGRDVMFHQVAVSEMAVKVRDQVERELAAKFALGKASKSKLENTPEKYLDAGAPMIQNYRDYCRCRVEVPGIRNWKKETESQLELAFI